MIAGKVVLLTPHRNDTDYRQWRDWYIAIRSSPPVLHYLEMRGLALTTMRELLAEEALKGEAEWLFWLDDDNMGPDNAIEHLVSVGQTNNLPIICGLYWAKKKKEDRCLAAWMKAPAGRYDGPWSKSVNGYIPITLEQQGRFIQVDVTGLGFALIHRSIFERLSKPWFVWNTKGPSEDFYFFDKVGKELGIKPVVDLQCGVRHIGTFTLEPDGSFTMLEM